MAVLACLIDGIEQVFANPKTLTYRLFEPPRKRTIQCSLMR